MDGTGLTLDSKSNSLCLNSRKSHAVSLPLRTGTIIFEGSYLEALYVNVIRDLRESILALQVEGRETLQGLHGMDWQVNPTVSQEPDLAQLRSIYLKA